MTKIITCHNQLFQKNISGTLSECQIVWIQIRADILSALIWVQTVCKGYQQMTKSSLARREIKPPIKLWPSQQGLGNVGHNHSTHLCQIGPSTLLFLSCWNGLFFIIRGCRSNFRMIMVVGFGSRDSKQ